MNYHASKNVDSNGQLILPKKWIEKNLNDEGTVAIYTEGTRLIIRPVREGDDTFFESKDLGLLALRR
ncbi:MAG: AbrB/MazE/SpoVT family DNA-binding domain-containing protein [Candidatus Heimdallarchaeota archaeon]